MHGFYCLNIPETGGIVELEDRDSRHLFKTLRGREGEQIGLSDGKGTTALAEITGQRRLFIVNRTIHPEPTTKLHLMVAVPRRNPMEQMLRQCAEIGVWTITPLLTERSVAIPRHENTPERWINILREGCKQSRNQFIPELTPVACLKDALAIYYRNQGNAFFGAPSGNKLQSA
ncbi:MAG: RsmE family RNA methyltransferase, partial [Victivallaceae bacterium]|nr:RsmE family RNA methyltransferase [Victivallaceae bacterium]